jgi:hypothetical protein
MNQQENKRRHLLKVFQNEEPIWKDEDHPELKDSAAEWVRKIRAECEDHSQKIQRYRGRE